MARRRIKEDICSRRHVEEVGFCFVEYPVSILNIFYTWALALMIYCPTERNTRRAPPDWRWHVVKESPMTRNPV